MIYLLFLDLIYIWLILFPGLPKLKTVVVVPYVKSGGDDAAISNITNGLVYAALYSVFFATFMIFTYILTNSGFVNQLRPSLAPLLELAIQVQWDSEGL